MGLLKSELVYMSVVKGIVLIQFIIVAHWSHDPSVDLASVAVPYMGTRHAAILQHEASGKVCKDCKRNYFRTYRSSKTADARSWATNDDASVRSVNDYLQAAERLDKIEAVEVLHG